MNKFTIGWKAVKRNEGGYANNPADRGGETFMGIARNFHPGWVGWAQIDAVKLDASFPKNIEGDVNLEDAAADFYRENFWNPIHGDELPLAVAVCLFDMAVNSGPTTAVRVLQKCLPGASVDGVVGPKTVKIAHENKKQAVYDFLTERLLFFKNIMDKDPSQNTFARGWFSRVMYLSSFIEHWEFIEKNGGDNVSA